MAEKPIILRTEYKTVNVQQVSVKDKPLATGGEGKKKWELLGFGIKVDGKWCNGTTFSKTEWQDVANLDISRPVNIVLFKEQREGRVPEWKFRLPNDKERLDALEKRIVELEAICKV